VLVVAGQPNVYMGVAQAEVGMMVHLLGCRADGVDDREPGREVPGVDASLQAAEQVCPPVQPLACDLLSGQLAHWDILACPGPDDEPVTPLHVYPYPALHSREYAGT